MVGRKNYDGSGSQWSAELAEAVMSVLMTAKLWKINPRTWLSAYLQACAEAGGRVPDNLRAFIPWQMDEARLATMRAPAHADVITPGIDTS